LADCLSEGQGRLYGVGDPGPATSMAETVRELHWLAENGFVSVGVPGIVADAALPPLVDPYFEPFWAACAETGLALSIHAGWGHPQGAAFAFFEQVSQLGELDMAAQMALAEKLRDSEGSPLLLDLGPRRVAWQLMLAGVFDRHPSLKLVLTEIRADWVPGTLHVLDEVLPTSRTGLSRLPSQYFADHCWLVPSSPHRAEVEMRHEIGLDRLMFGSDYPHIEGTWPNTQDWIRAAFAGVPEDEARAVLGENALRCYGLDRELLTGVAEKVGPEVADVLVDEPGLTPELLAAFHKRSGYARPADPIDGPAVTAAVDEDLALVDAVA
jgi:predicted TIM-barrel fold metal-dependent hydrolase